MRLQTDFDRVSWKLGYSSSSSSSVSIVYEPISIGLVGNTAIMLLLSKRARLRTDFDRVSWKLGGKNGSYGNKHNSLRTDFDRVSWKLFCGKREKRINITISLRTDFDRVSWKPCDKLEASFCSSLVYKPISIGLVGNLRNASTMQTKNAGLPIVFDRVSWKLVICLTPIQYLF